MSDHRSDARFADAHAGAASPRVDLILQQLDHLPTLSSVAVRIIELTTSDDSHADEIIRLIANDPALSSRVLKLSRSVDRTRGKAITTIERAVVHLGFEAVRSAVLSVELFDFFEKLSAGGELREEPAVFDRVMFWHHSLAVSILAERLVSKTNLRDSFTSGEASLAGLLHDLGMLALHVMLPKSMDRACQMAENKGVSLAAACGRVIGITSHTTGKRLAERWHLPRFLGDVMWLHGQPNTSLPELPHRGLITLISLADSVARSRHLTFVGHAPRNERIAEMCSALELDPTRIEDAAHDLRQHVAERAITLGLEQQPDWDLVLRSLSKANQSLGRMNDAVRAQAALAQHHGTTLDAITQFQQSQSPGDTVITVLEKVAQSARQFFGDGFYAMLLQHDADTPWQLVQFTHDGFVLRSETINPPQGSAAIEDLADDGQVSMQMLGMLPWLSDYLIDACDLRSVRLLPLRCGWGVSAVLLHDRDTGSIHANHHYEALSRTWAAAIAAGGQHEGARALGEQLAEANRMLVETQEELAAKRALASLGEIVAGAAHEMNNPLTVISGRAQQLAHALAETPHKDAAALIASQSHRLSDLLSALREFTEPAIPQREPVDLASLVVHVVNEMQSHCHAGQTISVHLEDGLPLANLDAGQMADALSELLRNAVESKGSKHIELSVQIDPSDDRLTMQVRDDGNGLNSHTLAHAFDPFFSSKPAGRQPGLGLSRARRYVEAHDGRLSLENATHGGANATIRLRQWRNESLEHEPRAVA